MDEHQVPPEMSYRTAIGQAMHSREKELVRIAMEAGFIECFRKDVLLPSVSQGWLDDHLRYTPLDPHEDESHRRLKLEVATYLDNQGVNMPQMENPDPSEDSRDYLYTGFEVEASYGKADVGSIEDGVYAEVGRTNPERLISAFGLVATLIRGVWREHETNTTKVLSVPYDRQKDDSGMLTLYEFRPGPNLEGDQE